MTVFDGSNPRADFKVMGELPLEDLLNLKAPGQFFNAKSASHGSNMVMERRKAWCDGKGRAFIPLVVSVKTGIAKGQGGYWTYDPDSGSKGVDAAPFDDSLFQILAKKGGEGRGPGI